LIYQYSGKLNVDSLIIKDGTISYTERSPGSLADGTIFFSNIRARIFNISNDPIYKTKDDSLKLFIKSLLMGKGSLTVVIKSKIFEKNNTLYVHGSLHGMDIRDLNPFLEKTEFIHINSGKLNKLNFSFVANNYKSTGQLIVRYNELSIIYMKMKKGLAAALTGMIFNIICNAKILNDNPMPGKELRVGIIDYKRDPERFVINYLLKSVMSGIKSSLQKSAKKKTPTDRSVNAL
jgi:hypothetical protein